MLTAKEQKVHQSNSTPKKSVLINNNGANFTSKKTSFAFGSSTPRELSHIEKVARASRLINNNLTIGNQNINPAPTDGEHSLSYYMRQARSITPHTKDNKSKCWAFGSSTPREFSHLNRLKVNQRIYDTKLPVYDRNKFSTFPDSKSATILSEKTSTVSRRRNYGALCKEKELNKINTSTTSQRSTRQYSNGTRLSDDASSEPDFVQDRGNDLFQHNTVRPLMPTVPVAKLAKSKTNRSPTKANTPPNKYMEGKKSLETPTKPTQLVPTPVSTTTILTEAVNQETVIPEPTMSLSESTKKNVMPLQNDDLSQQDKSETKDNSDSIVDGDLSLVFERNLLKADNNNVDLIENHNNSSQQLNFNIRESEPTSSLANNKQVVEEDIKKVCENNEKTTNDNETSTISLQSDHQPEDSEAIIQAPNVEHELSTASQNELTRKTTDENDAVELDNITLEEVIDD